MSEITPYINQQHWGRDLLSRLNNLGDDYGSFNVWTVLPTVGKDGEPLDERHRGYTGILTEIAKTTIQSWNGSSWDVLFSAPYGAQSVEDSSENSFFEETFSGYAILFRSDYTSDFVYIVNDTGDGFFRINKISKEGDIQWSASAPLPGGNLSFGAVRAAFFGGKVFVYVGAKASLSVSSASSTLSVVFCFGDSFGNVVWSQSWSKVANTYIPWLFQGKLSNNLVVSHPQAVNSNLIHQVLNTDTGSIVSSNIINTGSTVHYCKIRYDQVTDTYFGVVVNITSSASPVFIHRYNNTLTAILSSVQICQYQDLLPGQVPWDSICLFPTFQSNILYYAIKQAGSISVYQYNNTSGSSILLGGELAGTDFYLCGFQPNTDPTHFYFCNGSLLIKTEIVDDKIWIVGVLPPAKEGIVLSPVASDGFEESKLILKVRTTVLGFGGSNSYKFLVSFSSPNSLVIFFDDAYLSNTVDLLQIKKAFNVNSLFASEINAEVIKGRQTSIDRVVSMSETPGDLPAYETPGIRSNQNSPVNGGLHIYWGNLSSESQSYVAGNRSDTCGLLMGCENNAGRIYQGWHEWGAGAVVFDHIASRMFLCCAPGEGGIPGAKRTSFPNADGIVITSTNSIGIGLYSPAYKVDVNGTLRATTVMNSGGTVTSDERIKVGILDLDGLGLWEVCKELKPISFLYKPDFSFVTREINQDENGNDVETETVNRWELPQGIQYGWSAQNIRDQLPELVSEDRQSGVLYLNREALFPIFQSAVTEKIGQLEEMIAQKDTLLTQLQFAIESLTARVEALENAA